MGLLRRSVGTVSLLLFFFCSGILWSIRGPLSMTLASCTPPVDCGPGIVRLAWPSLWERWLITLADRINRPAGAPAGEAEIRIDISKRLLMLYVDGKLYKKYPVAIGRPSTPSPVGEWRIINKGYRPGGSFGTRWLGLDVPWGTYGIHGTNAPGSIGTAASHGCFRMFNKDVEDLYPLVPIGTRVIVHGPLKRVGLRRFYRQGATGQDIVVLQLKLRDNLFDPGAADGRYGPKTVAAVKKLQIFYGLPPTGETDANLLYLLGLSPPGRGENR